EANNVPHPRTWVFYDRQLAMEFADKCDLPIVYKSDMGSGSSGVIIFRHRDVIRKHIKRCFKKGFTTYRRSPKDREYDSVLFQEYLPDVREWRTVRIGDSFFAYEKVQQNDFHSGSHQFRYGKPPDEILDFSLYVCDLG